MTELQEKKLDEVIVAVKGLQDAIIGNASMGQPGIIPRIIVLEKYKKDDEKFKAKVVGGIAVATPLFGIFWNFIERRWNGT